MASTSSWTPVEGSSRNVSRRGREATHTFRSASATKPPAALGELPARRARFRASAFTGHHPSKFKSMGDLRIVRRGAGFPVDGFRMVHEARHGGRRAARQRSRLPGGIVWPGLEESRPYDRRVSGRFAREGDQPRTSAVGSGRSHIGLRGAHPAATDWNDPLRPARRRPTFLRSSSPYATKQNSPGRSIR
jgi:hypothetical protein